MTHLVSILIPAFNVEQWIGECIESALAQIWPRKEIIVVDDGSRDSTFEIARCYSSPSVEVSTQTNRGASAARNHALSLAQGDYIQWLDADDLLAPDKIASQLKDAEPGQLSRVLISGAWGRFYHSPEKAKFTPHSLWQNLEGVEWFLRAANENLWMAIDSWLVSRKLTEMAGPWNENLSADDDGDYFGRVVACSERIRFVREARCYVRRGNSGLSSAHILSDRKLISQAASIRSQISSLGAMEDSQRVRDACITLLQRWYVYFYPEQPDLMRQMEQLAVNLGGQLSPPTLRPKYRLLQKAFGWRIAKGAMHFLPHLRSLPKREWERAFHLLTSWIRQRKALYPPAHRD